LAELKKDFNKENCVAYEKEGNFVVEQKKIERSQKPSMVLKSQKGKG